MINFCKSWLGFSGAPDLPPQSPRKELGLLVVIAADDFRKPPNVLTSPAVKPADKPPDLAASAALPGCDGLLRCTESLGFESSDEIGAGSKPTAELARSRSWRGRKKAAAAARTKEVKFPPPLPSLNRNGQRSSYLRVVRKEGRILITEVRTAEKQELLRACREDGRLRLDLVRPRKKAEEDGDEEDGEGKGEEKGQTLRQRTFPLTGGDCFRRCHDVPSGQHLHFLTARCVTTS